MQARLYSKIEFDTGNDCGSATFSISSTHAHPPGITPFKDLLPPFEIHPGLSPIDNRKIGGFASRHGGTLFSAGKESSVSRGMPVMG